MFAIGDRKGMAVSEGEGFRALVSTDAGYAADLEDLLRMGISLEAIGRSFRHASELDLEKVKLLPPILKPGKILCVGLNYHAHVKEFSSTYEVKYPEIFARFASCLVGHKGAVTKPELSDQVDYEGELAVVIGKAGRSISRHKAIEHVAGYSIFNDVTIRDYQKRVSQWTMGKNFDGTGPFGPWLVTPDELPPGAAGLRLTTRLNGKIMQDSNTDNLIFDVPALIEFLSSAMTLSPGDVIITGTPGGIGASRNPQIFMEAGDVIEVEIERIGILSNQVAL